MKKFLTWICVIIMILATVTACEKQPTVSNDEHPLSGISYSLGNYTITNYFLGVTHDGKYYSMCDKLYDRDELEYFLVGSDYIGEAEMLDGEIIGLPDIANDLETNYLESGTKLYVKNDYLIGVYSKVQTSGAKSVYGILFKTTEPAQLHFDLSEYDEGIFTVNVLMYDDTLYGICGILVDPTELLAYALNGEYVGDILAVVSDFSSSTDSIDDPIDLPDDDPINLPENNFEATVLRAGTKLYLIGDNIAAKLPEPIKINGKVIYGYIYSKNGNNPQPHDGVCTCKYYYTEHGASTERTEIHEATDGRECVVTYTTYEHLMYCTECGKYLGKYYKECCETHSICSKTIVNSCTDEYHDFTVNEH